MPTSIDPQPAENEFECANCGAYFHYELTRCPNCGVNLYEPEEIPTPAKKKSALLEGVKDMFHHLFNKPYAAEDIFGDALDASILYNDLLQKTGGDHAVANRLIEYERTQSPSFTRKSLIQSAIRRWDSDNRNFSK
ncbi:MAG: hypothetical protein U0Z26_17210 [Anaerolineales bacterium]